MELSRPLHVSTASVRPPLRLGVIGCVLGRSRYHIAIQAAPSINITGIADSDERNTRIWARDIGSRVPAFLDVESLLARPETYDALLIASPLAERAAHCRMALEIGKPILLECPFAPGLNDVDMLRVQAESSNLLLMPALPRRFDTHFLAATQHLAAGTLGDIQQIRSHWSFPIENVEETGDIVTGGWNSLVLTLGSQTADVCRWWQGNGLTVSGDVDLQELRGSGHNNRGRRTAERALANIIVTHTLGQSTHHLSRTRAIQSDERYLFTGTTGNMELIISAGAAAASTTAPALRFQLPGQKFQPIRVETPTMSVGKTSLSAASLRIQNLLVHFADCVQLGETPRITPDDAYASLEIVQAAYVSTQQNVKVSLPLRRLPDMAQILLNPSHPSSLPALPSAPTNPNRHS